MKESPDSDNVREVSVVLTVYIFKYHVYNWNSLKDENTLHLIISLLNNIPGLAQHSENLFEGLECY